MMITSTADVDPGPLLTPDALLHDAARVARALLGCALVRDEVIVRITETEAYAWPGDTACHARAGKTTRTQPMWGPPGHAYVYLCYGIHHLLNIVCGPEGSAAAVLIRAVEPVAGHAILQQRRDNKPLLPTLLAGPGKVGQGLGLDVSWSGHAMLEGGGLELRRGWPVTRALSGPRVGIQYAAPADQARLWRFADANSAWVSARRAQTHHAP